MVLICDNAAYHHKREIGSLTSATKKELVEICKKYDVEYIDLPMTDRRHQAILEQELVLIEVVDDNCRVPFDEEEMLQRTTATTPFNPTTEELKYGLLEYISVNRKELLECKVKRHLLDHGHSVLWTPPYSPDLQPIELFWAAGKNHAASLSYTGIKMKETIRNVHEGWYGNLHEFPANAIDNNNNQPLLHPDNHEKRAKRPVDCMKLFETSVRMANKKFIPMCIRIGGTLGALTIDENHEADRTGIPIDILMAEMARLGEETDEYEDDNEQYAQI